MAGHSKWANTGRRKTAPDKLAVAGSGGAGKCHAQGIQVRKRAAASWLDWRP